MSGRQPPPPGRSQEARAGTPGEPARADTETHVDITHRLSPGTLVAGRYRIRQLLGMGGMGVVYRALDEEIGVEIALKVLRPDLGTDPRIMERFRSELVLARQVTHRNVVRIHDIGEHEGLRFLTMRLISGRSLREILERDGPLPVEKAIRIVRQVAEGLAQAHEAGVIHRDLKPGNILVDAEGNAFITDFGVARSLTQGGLTREGALVGTPDYLSPEQISGEPLDGRSDLYALGILFFEMLSGQLPFRSGTPSEMIAQRLSGRTRDVSETGIPVPPSIGAVIRRCLETNPSRRYPSAAALLEDLDRAAAPRAPRTRARVLVPVVAIFAAVVAVVVVAWLVHQRRARPPGPARQARVSSPVAARHAVAILPLRDETADATLAWTRTGIPELITAGLADVSDLRVIDSLRVRRTLGDLRLNQQSYDDRTLRQLAELWNVDRLASGTVRRSGRRIRVDLALTRIDAAGLETVPAFSAESDGPEGLFRAAGDLGSQLRRALGLEAASAREGSVPETLSIGAAKAYEEGRSRLLVGDDVAAAPILERAVAEDPKFAAALEALSQVYQGLGYHDKALRAAEQGLKAAGSGESRLGYRIRARLALLKGTPVEAEKRYRELVTRFPYDTEPRLDLAAAQAAHGHHAEAIETLKGVVALDPNDPRGWFLLGKSANLAGEPARAVNDYLVRALALQTRLGNEKGRSDVLNAIGVGYQQLGDNAKALENYTAALALRRKLGDDRGTAATLRNRALVSSAAGRPRDAERDLAAAREIFERIGDRHGLSDVLNDFGFVREGRGDYARALSAYQESLKIRRELGDERLLAQSYDNVGYIFFLLGEYDNALVYWQPSLDLRRKIGEKSGVVLSIQNLGFLQLAQGKWDEALKSFAEALEQSRAIEFKNGMAISLGNLGVVHRYQGRYKPAFASFQEALGLSRELDFKPALAEFTLQEAVTLMELGGLEAARARCDAAQGWIRETDNQEQAADLEVLRGEMQLERGEAEGAARRFTRAIELAKQSRSKVALLRARIASARALTARGQAADAAANLAAALREAESLGHALLTIQAAEGLARAELARGNHPRAQLAARRALDLAERVGWSAGLYRLYALDGRLLEASKDRAAAGEAYARSASEIAKIKGGLEGDLLASFNSLRTVRDVASRSRTAAK